MIAFSPFINVAQGIDDPMMPVGVHGYAQERAVTSLVPGADILADLVKPRVVIPLFLLPGFFHISSIA
jgi:hypothetical protein